MKNNVIMSSVVASLLVAWLVGLSASADETSTWNSENSFKKVWVERWLWDNSGPRGESKKGKGWFMKGLTDEEKTTIESMSDEQKEAYFETKKAEMKAEWELKKAEKQAEENVIDKLLAGETLTSEEEVLKAGIIEKRAEKKLEREAKESEREEMKNIMEKKSAWEELTENEQAKLDEMKSHSKKWGKKMK